MLMVPKSARAHSIKSRVVPKSAVARERVKNRSPTKAVKKVTPYELWMKKPNVDHLRVFGCNAYAHITKDERHKLDPKAKKCIFVGYGNETKAIQSRTRKSVLQPGRQI